MAATGHTEPVIVVTSVTTFPEHPLAEQAREPGVVTMLAKPFHGRWPGFLTKGLNEAVSCAIDVVGSISYLTTGARPRDHTV